MIITCIISSSGTLRVIPVLTRCITSIYKAKIKTITVRVVVTTNNAHHLLSSVKVHIHKIIVSPNKAGFVGINNRAVNKTIQQKSDYYLIINDDAWIDKNFFKNLKKIIQKRSVNREIIVPLVYESKGKNIDSFGVEYFRTGYAKNAYSKTISTTLASMSCLLIQYSFMKKMIDLYGYFLNPILVWYLEDVEFSIRANAVGATLYKNDSLVARHMRTFTWGRKSYMVMYYSFRNLIWTIYVTWPKKIIIKQLIHLLLWQNLVHIYCLIKYNPVMYLRIIWETILNWKKLTRCRNRTQKTYLSSFQFESLFSRLEVRHDILTF
ncbi:MAG: hypothetical protein V1917_04595 [Candidatus Gottesmanbacteria bacterium]